MSVFAEAQKQLAKKRLVKKEVDSEGQSVEYDVRVDEEQNVKLAETINLLLAAGYFRARIKGLSPFDKVVGGMTWCIQMSNFDVDVDLLFQENSTIGQKISLTEKIVAVLPRMKCPHRIEPHQIQGMDFIHIFPVVQWLVKRAIETREEMGDYIRDFSEFQFHQSHMLPGDKAFEERKDTATSSLSSVMGVYRPTRKYKKPPSVRREDEETQVSCTLLEYGRRHGLGQQHLKSSKGKGEKDKAKAAIAASLGGKGEGEDEAAEDKRISALMQDMEATRRKEGYISSQLVGSIVGLQSEEIKQMAEEYEGKRAGLVSTDGGQPMGAQAHRRVTTALQKQIAAQERKITEVEGRHTQLKAEYTAAQERLATAQEQTERILAAIGQLDAMVTDENRAVLERLRGLVAMNESLKLQEQQFKTHCQEELVRLKQALADLQEEGAKADDERVLALNAKFDADREKLQRIRQLLARKNREISMVQRKLDEVPSRIELSQYQKRLVELVNQVSSTGTETRQFYDLYNSSVDERDFMEKEFKIVSSIHENFDAAMTSEKNKDLFLKQFEQILENIRNERAKFESKRDSEKAQKDRCNDEYLALVDKQRQYYKTVKEFQEECRKNEVLLMKMQSLQAQ